MKSQFDESAEITDRLMPFSSGIFIVGSVAYDPSAIRNNSELEVIALIPDFKTADFVQVERSLGKRLNPNAIQYASEGKVGVFDVHYTAGSGFSTGIYFRSEEAHKAVCGLGSYNRFTDSKNTPRSCALRSLEGGDLVMDESESVNGAGFILIILS